MGGGCHPIHPPLWLPALRQPGQRPGETLRLHSVRPVRLPRRVLAGRLQPGQGAHPEHAPAGPRAALLRRGRARPPLATACKLLNKRLYNFLNWNYVQIQLAAIDRARKRGRRRQVEVMQIR